MTLFLSKFETIAIVTNIKDTENLLEKVIFNHILISNIDYIVYLFDFIAFIWQS